MQKTAYEMRMSDWSSDVCSPDLILRRLPRLPVVIKQLAYRCSLRLGRDRVTVKEALSRLEQVVDMQLDRLIGRHRLRIVAYLSQCCRHHKSLAARHARSVCCYMPTPGGVRGPIGRAHV